MIENIKGEYHLICDNCGEEAEDTFDTYNEALLFLMTSDWTVRNPNDIAWEYWCPRCSDG